MVRFHRFFLFLGICCFAVLLVLAGLWRVFGEGLRRLTLPLVRGSSAVATSVSGQTGLLSSSKDSLKRLQDVEKRISQLAIDHTRLQALEEENRSLRAQAKFLSTSGYDSVGARVISRSLDQQRALLLVDRGLNDHVEKGQAVVTNEGIFIGKIGSIKERVATVELLTDLKSRVAASVVDQKKLVGVIEGRGNGAAVLTYIPSSETLKRDQIIVTSGSEEKIPGHLPLGIINDVQGKQTEPFLTAAIEPLIPADQVVFVSILRPSALRPNL